jgi:hypothetical protein
MMIKAEELLKLNDDEKLAIINLLQSSLFDEHYTITKEQHLIIEERLEKIERGEAKFYSLTEFQNKINQRKKS